MSAAARDTPTDTRSTKAVAAKRKHPPEQRHRPAGTGRKARRRRREQARQMGGTLLKAPMLRGHTAVGRLRLLDAACGCILAPLFRPLVAASANEISAAWNWRRSSATESIAAAGLAIDVGVGESPVTTVELAAKLQAGSGSGFCSGVIGTEADEGRLSLVRAQHRQQQQQHQRHNHHQHPPATTLADCSPPLEFRLGGTDFVLPIAPKERPMLIRAMNVLRDYHQRDAMDALRRLYSRLAPDGILIEGSCSSTGDLLVAILIRGSSQELSDEADLEVEAVVFAVDLSSTDIDSAVPPPQWFARHLPRIWLGCYGGSADSLQAAKPQLRGGTGHGAAVQSTAPNDFLPPTSMCKQAIQAFLQTWERAAAAVREAEQDSTCRGVFTRSVRRLRADLCAAEVTSGASSTSGGMLANSVVEIAWVDEGWFVWLPAPNTLTLTGPRQP